MTAPPPARGDPEHAQRLEQPGKTGEAPMLRGFAVTGGKGGVGKTAVAVNIALALSALGVKPLLVDFDLGLANADVLLGLKPSTTLFEVVQGGRRLDQAIVTGPGGLAFLPAASGREELANLPPRALNRLLRELGRVSAPYDLVILDTAAGIGREVSAALDACGTIVVVVTPEPTSLTDAYAVIKMVESRHGGRDIRVVVNQVAHDEEGAATFARLRRVAVTYLRRELVYMGCIPRDRSVSDAVRRRVPVMLGSDGPARRALKALAATLGEARWS